MPARRSRSRSRGKDVQQPSIVLPGLFGLTLLVLAATAFRLPGFAIAWLGAVVIAFFEPPAILTGPKDKSGYPTPANAAEQRRLDRYQLWRDLKFKLLMPFPARPLSDYGLIPGKPVTLSWVAAVLTGGLGASLPTLLPADGLWLRAGNAIAGFVLLGQYSASARVAKSCPGTRFDFLPKVWRKPGFLAGAVIGLIGAAVLAYALMTYVPPTWGSGPSVIAAAAFAGLLLVLAAVTPLWRSAALEHWRIVRAADAEWRPKWDTMKQPVTPQLIDRQQVGPATVDTFHIPQGYGSTPFLALGRLIAPTAGAGTRVAVLSVPDENRDGPIPGSIHPNRFQVVTWPVADIPSLADSNCDDDSAVLLAHCCMYWVTEPKNFARLVPIEIARITSGESPQAAWVSTWLSPGGLTIETLRDHLGAADMAPIFGCEVLLDPVESLVYFGALTSEGIEFTETSPADSERLRQLTLDDRLDADWKAVLKTSPPVAQHGTAADAELADGTVVHKLAFVCRVGLTPKDVFGQERALGNTSFQAAPFIALTGFPVRADRPGERHPQAFTLYWSESRPPNLDRLAAAPAAAWVVAGKINEAFAAVKLPRPEVAQATALTAPRSRTHIWEIKLRHYDGVTMGDVRTKTERLRQALGVPWLRVAETDDGSILYAGAEPNHVQLERPARDLPRLKALDWNQAFLDAAVTGTGNTVPQLDEFRTMLQNESVEVLTFTLPAGLDLTSVKDKVGKLKAASKNTYVEVRPSEKGANYFTVVACETNPMPEMVAYDFAFPVVPGDIPFATGIDGEPIIWRRGDAPHLLFAGTSGSGKSAGAQNILYGAIVSGCELVVIDPTKGAADFAFLKPYARAIVGDDSEKDLAVHIIDAAATMKAVYAEGLRRRKLNSAHGVGSYLELPDDIRPAPMIVFIDEFVGLIGMDKVSRQPFDDPEMEHERQTQMVTNQAKVLVGQLSSKIAAEARAWGIHLILGTQKLPAAMLDQIPNGSILKVNLARILLGKTTPGDRMSALRVPEEVPPMPDSIGKGRGVWEPLDASSQLIQTWYARQSEYAAALGERVERLAPEQLLDIAQYRMSLPEKDPTPDEMLLGLPSLDDDDAVVDLGSMEFSLDELGIDLGAGPDEDPAVGIETAPALDVAAPFAEAAAPVRNHDWDLDTTIAAQPATSAPAAADPIDDDFEIIAATPRPAAAIRPATAELVDDFEVIDTAATRGRTR